MFDLSMAKEDQLETLENKCTKMYEAMKTSQRDSEELGM